MKTKKQETWNPELNAEENFGQGRASALADVLNIIDGCEEMNYLCRNKLASQNKSSYNAFISYSKLKKRISNLSPEDVKTRGIIPSSCRQEPCEEVLTETKHRGHALLDINSPQVKTSASNLENGKQTAKRCLLYLMQNKYNGCSNHNCSNLECPLNKKWERK